MQNDNRFYQESNNFHPARMAISILVCLFIALVLGYAYSILIWIIPLIYLNFLATIGFGIVLGMVVKILIRLGHIRHFNIKILLAVMAGLFANYFQWTTFILYAGLGHIPSVGEYLANLGWIFSPSGFFAMLGEINRVGLWSMFGMQINGFVLTIIWLVEFLIILGLPVMAAMQATVFPYSEKLGKWYPKFTLSDDYEPVSAVQKILEGLQSKPLETIQQLQPGSGWRYSKIHIYYLPEEEKQYLAIEKVYIENRGAGKANHEIMVNNFSINKKSADLILNNFRNKKEKFDLF